MTTEETPVAVAATPAAPKPKPKLKKIRATPERMGIALLVDWTIFLIFVHFIEKLAGPQPLPLFAMIFAMLYLLNFFLLKAVTPGAFALGIDKNRIVDRQIYQGENWLTLIMGVYMIWTGTKLFKSSWMFFDIPTPIFSWTPPVFVSFVFAITLGLAAVVSGLLILKLHKIGLWIAVGEQVIETLSTIFSQGIMSETAVYNMARERSLLNLPPQDLMETDKVMALSFTGLYALAVLVLAGLFFIRKKLK